MDTVAALHRALVESLIQLRPNALTQPVTVAEIYQDLIPYRSVKGPLGFALNADYEHALLHLLAGDDGYARIEPEEVRETLSRELKSPNPDVGLFRDYASCDVFVTVPEDARDGTYRAPERTPEPEAPARSAAKPVESWEAVVSGATRIDAADAVRGFAARTPPEPPAAPKSATAMQSCVSCAKPLPAGKNVRFCPHCGADQTQRLCKTCKEPLEKDWKFCIACGSSV